MRPPHEGNGRRGDFSVLFSTNLSGLSANAIRAPLSRCALRTLAAAAQPGPVKRHIPGPRGRDDPELPETAAAELFLHLGALHERHAAHLHRAPDHSGRVTPLLRAKPIDGTPAFHGSAFLMTPAILKNFFLQSVCVKSLRSQGKRLRLAVAPAASAYVGIFLLRRFTEYLAKKTFQQPGFAV